jgi:hypothetical protein
MDEFIGRMVEKKYPETVNVVFIFISKELSVSKTITEKIDLQENGLLNKELLLYLIQNKRRKKYKLMNILLYQNDIDNIDCNFETKLNGGSFLKIVPVIDNIVFDEQIPLFHSLNCVYVLLNETNTEIVNGRKTFKRVPYKKYTRKIKYSNGGGVGGDGGVGGGSGGDGGVTVLKDNSKKTRKNVSFV